MLSPSTAAFDLSAKRHAYCAMPTVRTVAFIDPERETVTLVQRTATGWTETAAADALACPALGLSVPAAEVFACD